MNALNPEVVGQFEKAVDEALNGENDGLVIGGAGKAFVAGADIKFFVEKLHEDNFPAIYEFTADGQVLFNRLSGGKKPVIARVQGLSLGGGSELALACDWIVATQKGSFGFPETGIGIYPGLGGTQRLTRRVGIPLAKYLVFTGEVVNAETALKIGLVDRVVSFADLDKVCGEMAAQGVSSLRETPQSPADPAYADIWHFFSRYRVEEILAGEADTGGNPVLEKAVKRMGYKSPAALRVAELLIEEGAEVPLLVGLGMELERLEAAFSHPDALEGLSSLIERRRPNWKS
jgi:enoyl-CoA hydratase/3-hydroxyacyl-CoA dehydrogenase